MLKSFADATEVKTQSNPASQMYHFGDSQFSMTLQLIALEQRLPLARLPNVASWRAVS
jgi:hypothetical protein